MNIIIYYDTNKETRTGILQEIEALQEIENINFNKCKIIKNLRIVPLNDMRGYKCDFSFFPKELRGTDEEKIAMYLTFNRIFYY